MAIKVINIGASPLKVALGQGTSTIQVHLRTADFVYSQDARLTNSLLIYQRKGLITIKTEEKPDHLQYNVPYNAAALAAPPKEDKKEEPVELDVQNVGGQIVHTKDALEEALKPHDERGNKGDIPEEVFEQVETEQTSILDAAKEMVEDYKDEGAEEKELVTGRWSDEEIKSLRKNYPIHGLKKSAEILNRSEKSVQKKVEALKLRKKKKK